MSAEDDVPRLELLSTIGFNGLVNGGLIIHPDKEHMVYPLGNTVIVRNLNTNKQDFLTGHTNTVSCLVVSKSGKYIASGQVTHMGFKAAIMVWDYEKRCLKYQLILHKVKVEALAFSPNELYLVSLGGQDDNSVVVWNLQTAEAVCGSPAAVQSAGTTFTVKYASNSDDLFVTAGDGTLRVWELDLPNRKIRPQECNLGQLKRIVKCVEVDENDEYFYCGTTSGDILKINMKTKFVANHGPAKGKFSQGIADIKILKNGNLLIGAGDGTLALVNGRSDKYCVIKQGDCKLKGAVSSIALRGQGHQFFVGTNKSQIYRFNLTDFKEDLVMSAHYQPVLDVAFPLCTSDLVATCSGDDIRVWHTCTSRELLRISVPNMICHAIEFMPDGHSLISAWNDGKIRVFLPESGKVWYVINNAHNSGVTAVAATSDSKRIISGGGEGQVRVWDLTINPLNQKLREAMKEHKSSVTCIKVGDKNKQCVSASSDGTCIIWDLINFSRKQMVMSNTLFQCVCYHPAGFQIITSGTDRKIVYWECYDGNQIRELDGSQSGAINGMDICPSGRQLITGGDDKLIKVWDYNEGMVTHVGQGHSGNITRVKMCPERRYIVSVSRDGAIIVWKYPQSC
uniref:Cilia- and flagella-associated protein 52 n=1 Tax=Phallusia mammillata TaxID=59560 RepID=A0A6F9DW58_9ASCI|nr:WD repeat-containing protein 16-like [Phallusia mammillata]